MLAARKRSFSNTIGTRRRLPRFATWNDSIFTTRTFSKVITVKSFAIGDEASITELQVIRANCTWLSNICIRHRTTQQKMWSIRRTDKQKRFDSTRSLGSNLLVFLLQWAQALCGLFFLSWRRCMCSYRQHSAVDNCVAWWLYWIDYVWYLLAMHIRAHTNICIHKGVKQLHELAFRGLTPSNITLELCAPKNLLAVSICMHT